MDLNPYAAPHEPDCVQPPAPSRTAPGGKLRKLGVRVGAVSLIAFFSIFGVAVVAAGLGQRQPSREFLFVFGSLVILSGVCGLLSLLLTTAGVAVKLLSSIFGNGAGGQPSNAPPSRADYAGKPD